MKKRLAVLISGVILVLSLCPFCLSDVYYRMLFERMVYFMESTAYPRDCIAVFQEIIKRHSYDRPYAARSQLFLGLCYKRMGSDLAKQAFRNVIKNFPDQTEVVKVAGAELAGFAETVSQVQQGQEERGPRLVWKGRGVCGGSSISLEGDHVLYTDLATGGLMIYRLADNNRICLTGHDREGSADGYVLGAVISRNCRQVAYVWKNRNGRVELKLVNVDGSGTRVLLNPQDIVGINPMDWTADSNRIIVNLIQPDFTNQIALVSISDGSVESVLEMGILSPPDLKFSPDDTYFVYSLFRDENTPERDLYLYNLKVGRIIPVATQVGNNVLLGWAPDGKSVYFSKTRSSPMDVWTFSVRDGKVLQTTERIDVDFSNIQPLNYTRNGIFYFETKLGVGETYSSGQVTEIWACDDVVPKANRTLVVPEMYSTITSAINAARSGDTVYVKSGKYIENILIDKPLTLSGEDRKSTIIDGGGRGT